MKKTIILSLMLFGILGCSCAYAALEKDAVRLDLKFQEPEISPSASLPGYDHIEMEETLSLGEVGEPQLPIKGITVLIPPGKEVNGVELILGEKVTLPGRYNIEPGQKEYPISQIGKITIIPDKPKPEIYESEQSYPAIRYKAASLQKKMGYSMLPIEVFPVEYNPKEGTISYYKEMTVRVKLKTPVVKIHSAGEIKAIPQIRTGAKAGSRDKEAVLRQIDNKEDIGIYDKEAGLTPPVSAETIGPISSLPSGKYDYVIITCDAFAGHFEPLKNHRIAKGLTAAIVTTEWIYANYQGNRPAGEEDDQTRIRNFIIDAWNNWGTQFVLLAGDGDSANVGGESGNNIIPARYLSGECSNNIPSDLYYACLDGTFDYDKDGIYGEGIDGDDPPGGEIDLLSEVYVGRAPVDSVEEADNFVAKTIAYENSADAYLKNAYMVGEYLGDYDYAAPYMEQIRFGATDKGFTTYGFLSNPDRAIDADTLYDSPRKTWSSSELVGIMNNGVHILNHLGHSNVAYNMKLTNSDVDALYNDKYFIVYSEGCLAGAFDNDGGSYDCIGEHFTTSAAGAVAFIGNSRVGYTFSGQQYNRQFWDALFYENIRELGRMNQDSKEENISYLSRSRLRWTYFIINLLGDPALSIHLPGDKIITMTNYKIVDLEGRSIMGLAATVRALNQDAAEVTIALSCSDPNIMVDPLYAVYNCGDMSKGESKNNSAAPFKFEISGSCPRPHDTTFTLTITDNGGYNKSIEIWAQELFLTCEERQITSDLNNQQNPSISGNRIVWEDYRSGAFKTDIYMYDLSTDDTEWPITKDKWGQYNPSISGDCIVWEDHHHHGNDIYMYDLSPDAINPKRRITNDATAFKEYPSISGNYIVWHQTSDYSNYDIYTYNILTPEEPPKQITSDLKKQQYPSISGNYIVWQDNRYGNFDIYMYDIDKKEETRLTNDSNDQTHPVISGNYIVWEDWRNGKRDIYVYDLSKKETGEAGKWITDDSAPQITPSISGNYVVWEDCRDWRNGMAIYMYNLSTNTEKRITNPSYFIHRYHPFISGNCVVWEDDRNGNYDIYLGIIDITAPYMPIVTDDGEGTASINTLSASWLSSDPESGILEYQYRITQDFPAEGTVIRDWTSTQLNTSVTATGLTLEQGKTYYFGVKVKNTEMLWSDIGYSDGIVCLKVTYDYDPITSTNTKTVYNPDNTIACIVRQELNSWAVITTCKYNTANGTKTETLYTSKTYTIDSTEGSVLDTDKIKETDYDSSGRIIAVRFPNLPNKPSYTFDGQNWIKREIAINQDLPNYDVHAIEYDTVTKSGRPIDKLTDEFGETFYRFYINTTNYPGNYTLTKDYPAGTPVGEHIDGATYSYCGASYVTVPADWKEYTGTIGGESSGYDSSAMFRPGTKYVRILFLHGQWLNNGDYQLRFDNLCFKDVTKDENLIRNYDASLGNVNIGKDTYAGDGVGDSVCFTTGPSDWTSDDYIPVDSSKTYQLGGWFKSVGTAGLSKLYYGVACYDKDQKFIAVMSINRLKDNGVPLFTTLAHDAKKGDAYVDLADASKWKSSPYYLYAAFNVDTAAATDKIKETKGNYNPETNIWISCDKFAFVGIHPDAYRQPTSTGKILVSLHPWNNKLYVGFGDGGANTGPIAITPYNPLLGTFNNEWTSDTEAVYRYRTIGSSLYAPAEDAHNRSTCYAVGNEKGEWSDIEIGGVIHAFDMATLNGSDLWLAGSKWMTEGAGDGAALWHKKDSGSAWEVALTIPSSVEYRNVARFYFVGVYQGKLYVQNGAPAYQEPQVSKVYDGNSWSDGPNLLPIPGGHGWKPIVFADKMIYKSKGGPSELMVFDGENAKPLLDSRQVWDFTVDGDTLYVLFDNMTIAWTKDISDWTTLPTPAPVDSWSIAVLNNLLYAGTANSRLYALDITALLNNVDNSSPELASIGDKYVDEGGTLSFDVSANDPDKDAVIITASGLKSWMSFDFNRCRFTASPGYKDSGSYKVTFTVSDGALKDSEEITITVADVNRSPVLDAIGAKIVKEKGLLKFWIRAKDLDTADKLTYSTSNLPAGANFDAASRIFSWIPEYGAAGEYKNVHFEVNDGALKDNKDSEDITIIVDGVNSPPDLKSIGNITMIDNGWWEFTLSAEDPDIGDTLIYSVSNSPDFVSVDIDGTVDLMPEDQAGEYKNVRFEVSDGGLSDYEEITIKVIPENKPPTVNAGPDRTIYFNQTTNLATADLAGEVTDDGFPGSKVTITWSKLSGPGTVTFGDKNKAVTTASFSAVGTYYLRLRAYDGYLYSIPDTLTITVLPDQPPVLNPIVSPQSVDEGGTLSFDVSASDQDTGDVVTITADMLDSSPLKSWMSFDGSKFTAKPGYEDSGSYDVTFTANDKKIYVTMPVIITVTNVNRAPVITGLTTNPDPAAINKDQTLTAEVTAKDDDKDTLYYTWETNPSSGGSIIIGQGTTKITYKPADIAVKTEDRITVTVSDKNPGGTAVRYVDITVNPVNDAPKVNAGPDQTIYSKTADLTGTVTDDGLPNPPGKVTVNWSKISGPTDVTFDDATAVKTTAAGFSAIGKYILRLTANDSELPAADDIVITIMPQPISPESIIPKPQNIQTLSSNVITLDSSWKIAVDLNNEDELFTAGYLQKKILEKSDQSINLEVVSVVEAPPAKRIIIGSPAANPTIAAIALAEGIDINTELAKDEFNQGYILLIKPNEIVILAGSTAGTFYGTISLTWLLEYEGGLIILPNTKITDRPDLKIRGFYGGGNFQWNGKTINTGSASGQEEWIDVLAKYKYNLWQDGLGSSCDADNLLSREKFLRNRHFFTGVSCWLSYVRDYDRSLYEGVWVQNLPAVFNDLDTAELEPLPSNLLKNPGFEIDSDSNGFPDNWYQNKASATDSTYWSLDNTTFHSGSYSVKLTVPNELTGITSSAYLRTGDSEASKYYDLLPDRIYQLSAWAKKNTQIDKPQTQITGVFYHDDKYLDHVTSVKFEGNGNEWKQYKSMFSTFNGENKLYLYSRAQGTDKLDLWVDDLEITEVSNRLINVIENDSTKIHVRDYVSGREYEEGRDFFIERTGWLNPSDPIKGSRITIKRITNGRIPPHAKISIEYDFLPMMQQDRVEYNSFADPKVLTVYKEKTLEPILTCVTPDFVFIGMDEVRGFNRDSRSKKLHLENYELMAQFLNKIIDIIHSYNKDIKVLIWDDMVSPYHNGKNENYQVEFGGQLGKTCPALNLIQKENVVFIPWWYGDDYWDKMLNSPALYNQLNFEFLGGPWCDLDNIKNWSYLCWRSHSLGMMDHEFSDDVGGVEPAANYSWNTIKDCNVDNPPVLELKTSQQVDAGKVLEFVVHATDKDGDIITFTCPNPPQDAGIVDSDPSDNYAVFRWDVPDDIGGKYLITIEARDGKGGYIPRDVNITVDPVNPAPVLAPIGNKSVAEGGTLSFDVRADDPDGDVVTITAAPLENWMSFNGKTFTASPGYEDNWTYNVTFIAKDTEGAEDSETITITVTNVVVISQDPNSWAVLKTYDYKEDGGFTEKIYTSESFTLSSTQADCLPAYLEKEIDYDSSGRIIAVRFPNLPNKPSYTFDGQNWIKREIAINQDLPNYDVHAIEYDTVTKSGRPIDKLTDEFGETFYRFYINTTNYPGNYTLTKDYPAGTPVGEHIDGATYSYCGASYVTVPADWKEYTGTIGGESSDYDSSAMFRPGTKYVRILFYHGQWLNNGDYQLRFDNLCFKDVTKDENLIRNYDASQGSANIGKDTYTGDGAGDSVCFTTGPSDWTSDDYIPVDSSKTYKLSGYFKSVGAAGLSKLYYGVACYDKEQKFISCVSINRLKNNGVPLFTTLAHDAKKGDTCVDLADASKWKNSPSYLYIVFDVDPTTTTDKIKETKGNYDPKTNTWTQGTSANNPPVWDNIEPKTVDENQPLNFTVSAQDPDPGDTTLTYDTESLPAGAAFNAGTKTFSWTPNYEQSGDYKVTFTVTDSIISAPINAAAVIKVDNVNRPPVINGLTANPATIDKDHTSTVTVSAEDKDSGDTLSYTWAVSNGGSITGSGASVTYKPANAAVTTTDTVTVTVKDNNGGTAAAVVKITITAGSVNHPPAAENQKVTTTKNTSVSIILKATDIDGDSLTYKIVNLATKSGTLTGTVPNLTYKPRKDFVGYDLFIFRANDGKADSNTAVVTINVGNRK